MRGGAAVRRPGRAGPGQASPCQIATPRPWRRSAGVSTASRWRSSWPRHASGCFTPAQIAEGLSERFRLLTGASRTALPRQQTLEASVDWSHALLTDFEQTVFRRLAVFAGDFTFDAAQDVAAGRCRRGHQVLDLLSLLVDKSLVVADVDDDEQDGPLPAARDGPPLRRRSARRHRRGGRGP